MITVLVVIEQMGTVLCLNKNERERDMGGGGGGGKVLQKIIVL